MNQVYKITNQINGKVYIGITTQDIKQRWSEHISRFKLGERDHKLYQAMRKHRIENFNIELICEVNNAAELADLEIQYIEKHDSFNNGYNMTCGGDVVSEETKQKLSEIFKGRKITWYDKILASKRKNGTIGGGIIWKGDHPQLVEYQVKHPNGRTEKIKGLRIFCRKYGLDHKTLLDTLKGKQHHHKGFVLLSRFNDYCESKYSQVAGNGEYPVSQQGSDIVLSAQQCVAVA